MTTTDETLRTKVLRLLRLAGRAGITWREVQETLLIHEGEPVHHGRVSGVLSSLDTAGQVVRLTEKRAGNSVYVMPEERRGRPRATARSRPLDDFLEEMLSSYDADGHCLALHGPPPRHEFHGADTAAMQNFITRLRHLTGHDQGPFSKVK